MGSPTVMCHILPGLLKLGCYTVSFFYSALLLQLFDLILSQVLWQGDMALSLLSLRYRFDQFQYVIDFLDVNFNLFAIYPSTDSMTTKQTDTEQGFSGLIHWIGAGI